MRETKPWTILIYMAADNNLYKFARANIKQMRLARMDGEANVIAQIDGPEVKTRRIDLSAPKEPKIPPFENINSGSFHQLERFLKWGIKNYRAEHYAIVLWGHGTGLDAEILYFGPEFEEKKKGKLDDKNRTFRLAPLAAEKANRIVALRRQLPTVALTRENPGVAFRKQLVTPVLRKPGGVQVKHADALELRNRAKFVELPTSRDFGRMVELIAPDNTSRSYVSNKQLRDVLRRVQRQAGGRISILGTDACVMSMIELCYEFRCIPLIVSSEGAIPSQGWPYHRILRGLKSKPAMTPGALAVKIVKEYTSYYHEKRYATTLSVGKLASATKVVQAIDHLATRLLHAIQEPDLRKEISISRKLAQQFDAPEYVDLYDFCQILCKRRASKRLQQACLALMKAIAVMVILSKHSGRRYERAKGLSIYFPRWLLTSRPPLESKEVKKLQRAIRTRYQDLQFSRRTKWDDFLMQALEVRANAA